MRLAEALIGVGRLCIDTAPFIYYAERSPGRVDKMRAIFLPVHEGRITAFTSALTLTEALTKPIQARDAELIRLYQTMFRQSRYITLVPIDAGLAERAAELRARYSLKTPDALQVATALWTGCDAFLTNDLNIRRVEDMRVLVLDELELTSQ
ncbi:MAG: PIN domain-containing protein [Anaerolineae bacterium]|nr:PIN domain-containing protein [Anaerolineae bacterium]